MGLCPGVNSCLSTSRLCDVSHLLFIITCSYCILQLPDLYTLTCPKLSFAAFDLLRGEIWSLSAKFRRSSPAPFLKRNCMWPHFLLLCALGVAWRRKIELFIFASCNSLEHRIDSAWFSSSTSSTVQHATHYDTKGLVRGCWHCLVQLQHYDFSFLPPVTHCTFRSRPASRRTSCLKATKNQDHSLISRP